MHKLRNTTVLGALSLVLAPEAWAQGQQAIDIPEQPLVQALDELSAETGTPILVQRDLVIGLQSQPVTGPMSPRQALEKMVGVPEFTVRELSDGSLVVSRNATLNFTSQNVTEDPFDLGTLVLRGELIERDVQDSQTSAVIVTGEDLEERNETSLDETLRRVPGVNGQTIRGIAPNGLRPGAGTNQTVNLSVDGVRISDFGFESDPTQISTWDIEQVDVLRGPQSTQSGRNALSGAIILESVKPQFFPEYKFRLGATENNGYQAAFVLNQPLIEDRLAFRLSVDKQETDGFADNSAGTNDRVGFEDLLTIRAGLLYRATDRLSFGLNYSEIDNEIGTGLTTTNADFPEIINDEESTFDYLVRSPSLTVDYDVNSALSFSSRTQYSKAETELFTQQTATRSFVTDNEFETIEQEFRLTYNTDRVRAVGGLFYTEITGETSTIVSDPGVTEVNNSDDEERENYAIYGEVEYDLTSQWTLVAGARYDVEDIKVTSTRDIFVPGLVDANVTDTFDSSFDAFLPKLGVVYNFTEDVSLGFTYQRGYRGGGAGTAVSLFRPPFRFDFEPEYTDTLELAFRSLSRDGTRVFNANVYYTEWEDQQVRVPDIVNQALFITNAGSSELWGAELDYRQLVTDNLEVFALAAYSKTEFKDFVFNGVQLAGNSFVGAPELTATLGANYAFNNGLTIGADVVYTGSSFSDFENTPERENDSYWTANLNASYTFENGVVLTGYVRNLFDEEYTTFINPVNGATGQQAVEAGTPREFGAFLTYTF